MCPSPSLPARFCLALELCVIEPLLWEALTLLDAQCSPLTLPHEGVEEEDLVGLIWRRKL
jgi:hypothetical protein